MSVDRLREDAELLHKLVRDCWDRVWKYLPRKADGEPLCYPGRCPSAGLWAGLEVGDSGNVHVHVLVYGAYHRVEDVRAVVQQRCPDIRWIQVTALRQKEREIDPQTGKRAGRKRALGSMINEVTTYLCKGPKAASEAGDGTGWYTHPLLVVLTEIALLQKQRHWGCGSMHSLVAAARTDERRCSNCGAPMYPVLDSSPLPPGQGARAPPALRGSAIYSGVAP